LIVHVHAWLKVQPRNQRGVYIHKTHRRMFREQMPAALLAPLAIADGRLVVSTNARPTVRDSQCLRFPQCKGVYRSCRPVAARFAVAVTHGSWRAATLKLTIPQKQHYRVNTYFVY